MDEIFLKAWPYLERAGIAASIILGILLWFGGKWMLKQLADRDATISSERKRCDEIQAERLKDMREIGNRALQVIEQNTSVAATQAERLRDILQRGQT